MRNAVIAVLVAAALAGAVVAAGAVAGGPGKHEGSTATPIKHLVVIFQENVSFDHYFATYPNAANIDGSTFAADARTPSVNGLGASLLTPNNPNSAQPFRLSHEQAETCDQDHNYTDEQKAFDGGLMDRFVETVGRGAGTCADYGKGKGLVMGYYDGNTVTALWNYAQSFAMSDNSFASGFGPSTPGALNLVSGQTHGFMPDSTSFGVAVTPNDTVIGDPQPAGDICDTRDTTMQVPASTDKNVGDLLSAKGITWGWFQGGFREASGVDAKGVPTSDTCKVAHTNVGGVASADYIPHHEPFQYYRSTQNLQHLPPSSTAMIGKDDAAHHQYDLSDFWSALDDHRMPAVSFVKAPAFEDGHAGYSDPLDEQRFVVETINRLEKTPDWESTAVVIAYDDSDGWYDHQLGPIVNQSNDPAVDALNGSSCGANPNAVSGGYLDRCGYGPRLPLLVVSRFAKRNYVDHSVTDQTSILRFVEGNWQTGQIGDASLDTKAGSLENLFDFHHARHGPGKLYLDPATGNTS